MKKSAFNEFGQWRLINDPSVNQDNRSKVVDSLATLLSTIKIKVNALANKPQTAAPTIVPVMKDFSTKKEELLSNLTSKKMTPSITEKELLIFAEDGEKDMAKKKIAKKENMADMIAHENKIMPKDKDQANELHTEVPTSKERIHFDDMDNKTLSFKKPKEEDSL